MAGNGTDALLAMMPFAAVLGIEEVTAAPDKVTGRVRWEESRCTSFGVHDDQDRLVGRVTQTQAVLASRP
jgi:hypothetical protein